MALFSTSLFYDELVLCVGIVDWTTYLYQYFQHMHYVPYIFCYWYCLRSKLVSYEQQGTFSQHVHWCNVVHMYTRLQSIYTSIYNILTSLCHLYCLHSKLASYVQQRTFNMDTYPSLLNLHDNVIHMYNILQQTYT